MTTTPDPQLTAICREACRDLLRAVGDSAFADDPAASAAARLAFTKAKGQICLAGSPALVAALSDYMAAVVHSAANEGLVPLVLAMRREAFHQGEVEDLADAVNYCLIGSNLRQ